MSAGESAGRKSDDLRAKADELEALAASYRRRAEAWELGAAGEQRVAAVLEPLRTQGWIVLHDLRKSRSSKANIDHLVVGPPGVFVIDAKNWSGRLAIDERGVRCGKWPRNDELNSVETLVAQISGELTGAGFNPPMHGVIALAQDNGLPTPRVVSRTAFCPVDAVPALLTASPAVLDPTWVQAIAGLLIQLHPSKNAPAPPIPVEAALPPDFAQRRPAMRSTRPAPPRSQRSRSRPAGRRNRSMKQEAGDALKRLILGLIVLLLAVTLLPRIAESMARGVVSGVPTPTPSPSVHGGR